MKVIFVLYIILILVGCKKYNPTRSKIEDDFVLTVTDTSGIRADGVSLITVKLSNTKEVKDGLKVSFSSTKGSFLFNDVQYQNDEATTKLKVDQDTGTYVIKALLKEGDQTKIEKTITFSLQRAWPDSIGLQIDRSLYSLILNNPITIKTFLFRNHSLVTKGTPVLFRAYQIGITLNDTIEVGRFEGLFNNYSTADGKLADIKLYADTPGIDTLKAINIQARTLKDKGDTLCKNIIIRYR